MDMLSAGGLLVLRDCHTWVIITRHISFTLKLRLIQTSHNIVKVGEDRLGIYLCVVWLGFLVDLQAFLAIFNTSTERRERDLAGAVAG
eukprot:scaffold132167_cov21-Prasinocladus_malaysianus.AAC.1